MSIVACISCLFGFVGEHPPLHENILSLCPSADSFLGVYLIVRVALINWLFIIKI